MKGIRYLLLKSMTKGECSNKLEYVLEQSLKDSCGGGDHSPKSVINHLQSTTEYICL